MSRVDKACSGSRIRRKPDAIEPTSINVVSIGPENPTYPSANTEPVYVFVMPSAVAMPITRLCPV